MAARTAEAAAAVMLTLMTGALVVAVREGVDTLADEAFWWSMLAYVAVIVAMARLGSPRLAGAGAIGAIAGGPVTTAGALLLVFDVFWADWWALPMAVGGAGLAVAAAAAATRFPGRLTIAGAILFVLGLLTFVVWFGVFLAPIGLVLLALGVAQHGRAGYWAGLLLVGSLVAYAAAAWALERTGGDGAYGIYAFAPLHAAGWSALGVALASPRWRRRGALFSPR